MLPLMPPIQLSGTRPAQAQVRFAATSNGSVTLGTESVPDVSAVYNVVLNGTQVTGAVNAGYNINASGKAKALSMKAGQDVKLDDVDVLELTQGATLISRNSRLGTIKGTSIELNGTQVNGNIEFESGQGKVILHPGAKINGEVIGGETIQASESNV